MLNWLFPAAFWFLLSVIPITLFYFLRMRFKKQPISSDFLWKKLRKDTQTGSRLHLKSILLLLLQILIIITITAALARPVWNKVKKVPPGTVFLLDVSASMSAKDTGKSRWETAVEKMTEEIKNLPQGTEIAVFLCSSDAEKMGEPVKEYGSLLNKLHYIKPSGAGFNELKVSEELEAWLLNQNSSWKACLITDGSLDLEGRQISAVFNGDIKVIQVGASGDDLGVTGLRILSEGEARFVIYNGYNIEKKAGIILEKDGRILSTADVSIQPGRKTFSLKFPGQLGNGVYTVKLNQVSDNFPMDDQYSFAVNPSRPVRVLLAGEQNPYLKAALKYQDIELKEVNDLTSEKLDPEYFDLTIADQTAVPADWKCSLLCFNSIPPDAPVVLNSPVDGAVEAVNTAHFLLRFTDMRNWDIFSGGNSLKIKSGAQVLLKAGDKPVLVIWEKSGFRNAVFGINLKYTDIGLSQGFPVFIRNFLKWCVPQSGNSLAYTLTAGYIVNLNVSQLWKLSDDKKVRIRRAGPIITLQILETGVYSWEDGNSMGSIAVNIPPGEMEIVPRLVRISTADEKMTEKAFHEEEPLTHWMLTALLALLFAEWYLWRGKPFNADKPIKKG